MIAAHYGDPFGEQRRLEAGDEVQVGAWAREAVRIAAGVLGPDEVTTEPGQQIVFLHLDGSDNVLPTAGDLVYAAGHPIGHITSAANHHELGPIAFAALNPTNSAELVVETQENGVTYQIAASA